MEKALFIPLKTKPFEAFERGEKPDEMRPYGPRWNEKTCRIGRAVTLSKGYGKQNRLYGVISYFERIPLRELGQDRQAIILEHYPGAPKEMALIGISLDRS